MIRVGEGTRLRNIARACDDIVAASKERLGYAGSDALRGSRDDYCFLIARHVLSASLAVGEIVGGACELQAIPSGSSTATEELQLLRSGPAPLMRRAGENGEPRITPVASRPLATNTV
jgi:hypothetical protein